VYAALDPKFAKDLASDTVVDELEQRCLALTGIAPGVGRPPESLKSADVRPTADPEELGKSVRSLLKSGQIPPPDGNRKPTRVRRQAAAYLRDPRVVAYVLQQANGRCELCNEISFYREDGSVYLEVHHVKPLADNGPDTEDNAVALCPTCHRKCHYASDKHEHIKLLRKKVLRLVQIP
jgi:5-methylcytosine-specific restriction protein A